MSKNSYLDETRKNILSLNSSLMKVGSIDEVGAGRGQLRKMKTPGKSACKIVEKSGF